MRLNEEIAEILGIHVGDGCISVNERYEEYALSGDINEEREYYDKWVVPLFNQNIIIPLLNKEIIAREYRKDGTYGFYIFNSKIVDFFLNLGISSGSKLNIEIPEQIIKNQKLSKCFLRGLFDTDGSIYFDKNRTAKIPINNRPNIKLGNTSKMLIEQVYSLLLALNYHPRLMKPYKGKRDKNPIYSVLLYRKADVEMWMQDIGFKSSKHITKWMIFKKLGYCLPYTTLAKRKEILK